MRYCLIGYASVLTDAVWLFIYAMHELPCISNTAFTYSICGIALYAMHL